MKVSLYATCIVDLLFPEVGVSVVRLLRRLGVEVDFHRDQTCCGQPVFNSGFTKEAKTLARRVLKSYQPAKDTGDSCPIVVPSGSCAAMMRVFYPQLFRDDPELLPLAEEMSGRVYEFSEFLVKVMGITDVGASFQGKVTYHPSCHLLRELGVSQEPLELVRSVKGAELIELNEAETCCGFGGTFSVKYPHISGAILGDKIENVLKTGAEALVSCDIGCLMHIGGGLSRRGTKVRPIHLAQLLEGE